MTEQQKNKFQQPGKVKVIQGSILAPENAGLRFVLNINNMKGVAESPLYPIFDKKWKQVKADAKGWYNTRTGLGPRPYKLGSVNVTAVQSDTWVLHMLCQDEEQVTDTSALTSCLKEICKMAKYERATVHVSTVLTAVAPELTDALNTELVQQGVSVYFYDEPGVELPKPPPAAEPVEEPVVEAAPKAKRVRRVTKVSDSQE